MNLNIEINTDEDKQITVQDISEYLPEEQSTIAKGKFKYSDTYSIDVLRHNTTKDEDIYSNPVFTEHKTMGYIKIPINFDGFFTVIHLVLPTKKWFDTEKAKEEGSALTLYQIVYYTDGTKIYKYINQETEEVTLEEILEINPIDTTISKIEQDYVSICYLKRCYIDLCMQILNDKGFSQCFSRSTVDGDLTFKRDLVWMALNVIKYLTECGELAEAQRIIENINTCNGLCTSNTIKSRGCGCCGKA